MFESGGPSGEELAISGLRQLLLVYTSRHVSNLVIRANAKANHQCDANSQNSPAVGDQ